MGAFSKPVSGDVRPRPHSSQSSKERLRRNRWPRKGGSDAPAIVRSSPGQAASSWGARPPGGSRRGGGAPQAVGGPAHGARRACGGGAGRRPSSSPIRRSALRHPTCRRASWCTCQVDPRHRSSPGAMSRADGRSRSARRRMMSRRAHPSRSTPMYLCPPTAACGVLRRARRRPNAAGPVPPSVGGRCAGHNARAPSVVPGVVAEPHLPHGQEVTQAPCGCPPTVAGVEGPPKTAIHSVRGR